MATSEGKQPRRDLLLEIQAARQAEWEKAKVFEINAPEKGNEPASGKYFGNFPYPYMNGLLHLGHAFSLSKLEFKAAFERVKGKMVLFPQAFHCTGMPIKACADKLDREISTFGNPPQFPEGEDEPPPVTEESSDAQLDATKFSGKKSKAAAKTGKANYQWQILEMSGIPKEEIASFRDAHHWLNYFPGHAMDHLKLMGCGIDWRRSFITTDVNAYYDSFVQWQFRKLKAQGKIIKDKRYAVYSILDGQPCADHDRASGEGVGPQEYTLIKMEAIDLSGPLALLEGRGRVFFMAATLRPETMYGQTNFWVLPSGKYGAYKGMNDEIYIMAKRSALNLSYQERMPVRGEPELILEIDGKDLIGVPVKSPNCIHEKIYALPLLTIKMDKGTGVVTSVPSDAPDDYIALRDVKENKNNIKGKFGVQDEWVMPFEVIPIIEIEGLGSVSAVTMCDQLKIKSQHDTAKLEQAKKETYLKGFTTGVMLVGEHAGKKVSEVKNIVKDEMLERGQAVVYSEPEKKVMSRSGDECVVALTDQWYITYGEDEWANLTKQALEMLNTYGPEARHNFEHVLDWLEKWAVSRAYGLGTRVPWDPEYLVESLSDSTIYMAYYTVAHILQNGDMYGKDQSMVRAEDMTDEVWDYIFLEGPLPTTTSIPQEKLTTMRREFDFWYPFDLRVSGKDLIQNHLTFCLYNHTAIWPNKEMWPRAFRCNGHIMLNADKMSKSTGNFLTLQQAIAKYSSDAMRVALADAGDGLDDANFEQSTANAAILRLTKELTWFEETLADLGALRDGPPSTFFDRVFENELNVAVHRTHDTYEGMMFRDALKFGWYDLQNARDAYRFSCKSQGLNKQLIQRFLEVSTILLAPICPHTMDHVWVNLLHKTGSALNAGWPEAAAPDYGLQMASIYIDDFITTQRKNKTKMEKAKKGAIQVTKAVIKVAPEFISWQKSALLALAKQYDNATRSFNPDVLKNVLSDVSSDPAVAGLNEKKLKSLVMPFAKFKMEQVTKGGGGIEAIGVRLPFDEINLLNELSDYVKESLGLEAIDVMEIQDLDVGANGKIDVNPGMPQVSFA